MTSRSVSKIYSEADISCPALYQVASEAIEQNSNIEVENIIYESPEIHIAALNYVFQENNTPLSTWKNRDPEYILDFFEVEDVQKFIETYTEGLKKEDMVRNGRDTHQREIDALAQKYIEGETPDRFDVLVREVFYSDRDYKPPQAENISLPPNRSHKDRIWSDIDFMTVDFDRNVIRAHEVKSNPETEISLKQDDVIERLRQLDEKTEIEDGEVEMKELQEAGLVNSYSLEKRSDRQLRRFREAVERVNQVVGTDYSVELDRVHVSNVSDREWPLPRVYEGDFAVNDESGRRKEELEEFIEFMDEFLYQQDFRNLDPLEEHGTSSFEAAD